MGELFQSFVYTMLGDVGLLLLDSYYQYENILLTTFIVYAAVLLYARCILVFYYAYRMKKLIYRQPQQQNKAAIRQAWLQEKLTFPFYILVPSRNELWVKRASKSSIEHGIAFFRERKTHKTDYEQLDEIENLLIQKQQINN